MSSPSPSQSDPPTASGYDSSIQLDGFCTPTCSSSESSRALFFDTKSLYYTPEASPTASIELETIKEEETPDESLPQPPTSSSGQTDDELDGVLSGLFLDTVKTVLIRLLTRVVLKYRNEICYGCQIDHPSQKQHECLEEIPEYFFQLHYNELTKRLWTVRFIPTLQRLLERRNIIVSEHRIQGASEAFLHDLKTTRRFTEKIRKISDSLTGEDNPQLWGLEEAEEFWMGENQQQ